MRVLSLPAAEPSFQGQPLSKSRVDLLQNGRVLWSVPPDDPDWLLPWLGWTCVVEDRFILQAYGYEHSRGGDVRQGLVVLNGTGDTVAQLAGEFAPGAVYTRPDTNRVLESVHLVEYWNGTYGYNTLVNAGQPPLCLTTYPLPGFKPSNRWMVEVPAHLKSRYSADGIRYKQARLLEDRGEIYIVSEPLTKDGGDLSFRVAVPWTG